mmetsp:Transcript_35539/g.89916  ORF Transcript_35539/g.89916 Transcript_35539/m.89916 type:complete len:294 (-) Transcript_35539:49-930(-)
MHGGRGGVVVGGAVVDGRVGAVVQPAPVVRLVGVMSQGQGEGEGGDGEQLRRRLQPPRARLEARALVQPKVGQLGCARVHGAVSQQYVIQLHVSVDDHWAAHAVQVVHGGRDVYRPPQRVARRVHGRVGRHLLQYQPLEGAALQRLHHHVHAAPQLLQRPQPQRADAAYGHDVGVPELAHDVGLTQEVAQVVVAGQHLGLERLERHRKGGARGGGGRARAARARAQRGPVHRGKRALAQQPLQRQLPRVDEQRPQQLLQDGLRRERGNVRGQRAPVVRQRGSNHRVRVSARVI